MIVLRVSNFFPYLVVAGQNVNLLNCPAPTLGQLFEFFFFNEAAGTTEDTTTESSTETTTDSATEAPTEPPDLGLEVLDYQFTSLTGGFYIDVNITEIEGTTDSSYLSMFVNSDPTSEFAKSVTANDVFLIAIAGSDCPDGIEKTTTLDGDIIASVGKTGENLSTAAKSNLEVR